MYHLLMLSLALATEPGEAPAARQWMLNPGSCSLNHRSAGMLLDCIIDHGPRYSREWSGDRIPPGSIELEWGAEPVATVLARAQAIYPELAFNVYDVGDRLFLATEPSFANHTLTLPTTSYPNGMVALEAILANARPDGMTVGLSQALNFDFMVREPRPITFRSPEGTMLDIMDQWLDTYLPGSGRWSLRCNTSSRTCTILVQRFTTATVPKGWIDTDP